MIRTIAFTAIAAGILAGGLLLPACQSPSAPNGAAAPAAGRPPARPLPTPIRGVWVARFHYKTPEDIRRIMRNAASIGCNTVYWQVRGEACVSYRSRLEPWGREFEFRDPGYDPLAIAVAEAHANGLRIEPWLNVMPGWKGKRPPPATVPAQLYNAHPEWFLHDARGQQQPLGDFYVIVNPCLPEVRRHIVAVCAEIASRYDIDGLHLDYVRFAWDGLKDAKQRFPRDPATLALYRNETGRRPDDDVPAWDQWRANQVTRLVGDVRQMLRRERPGASLTAAVWRNPQLGYGDFLQNSTAWLKAGFVDALMPMAYTDNLRQFEQDIAKYRRIVGDRRVAPGVGLYLHKRIEDTRAQMNVVRRAGGDVALYSYESLFARGPVGRSQVAAREEQLRALRRDAVRAGPASQ